MINASKTDPIWLIPEEDIGLALERAIGRVMRAYKAKYATPSRGNGLGRLVREITEIGPRPFAEWNTKDFQHLMSCCFREGTKVSSIPVFSFLSKTNALSAPTLFKLAFIHLWCERKVLLPLNFTLPIGVDPITDIITMESGCEALRQVRSANTASSIPYAGGMSNKERELRSTYWYRVILSSTIYNPEDLTEEDIEAAHQSSSGRKTPLSRYYVTDLLVFIAENTAMRDRLNDHLATVREKEGDERKTALALAKRSSKEITLSASAELALSYLEGGNNTTTGLADAYDSIAKMRKGFAINDENFNGGYNQLPEKVRNFCSLINTVYRSYVRSKRLQRDKDVLLPLNMMLCYCAIYLYQFYMKRDGHLGNYPVTLNDFSCALYITADHLGIHGFAQFVGAPPQTLLSFVAAVSKKNNWSNETQYNRTLYIEKFFTYTQQNTHTIPNSDKVRNTFTPDCYPKLQRRYGTVKKPVPRLYFSTFVSMIYSLEYLVMHLNDMADGVTPGVVAGKLKHPNHSELSEHPDWSGLWGNRNLGCDPIDLAALNYCPIFYHNDRIQRFEYIPRFYRFSNMEIGGRIERRVVTNDIRLTQLMCETGIRQHHLIWLDKEQYDRHVDRSSRRALAPLFVSTDKAHGEWSAITSKHVIELLDRQRDWYDRCTNADYQDDLWYGMSPGSKFGRFKPLFRLDASPKQWANYTSFPLQLLTLQYFLKAQLGDLTVPDLVFTRDNKRGKEFISDYTSSALSKVPSQSLKSDITPHGLRAGFVSEAIKYLPPSLVGKWMTGQSEELVYFYALLEDDPAITHEQLLCNVLMRNADKIKDGDAPHLADAILKLNQRLKDSIERNPEEAITKHRLMSLAGLKAGKNGLEILRAKELSYFAYNATHICPFNNVCPREIAEMFGMTNVCAMCPFAIRGIDHIPAVNAEKDKYKELMIGVAMMIAELMQRKSHNRSETDLEKLEHEHDHFARQAVVLESIEIQLVDMANQGKSNQLMVQKKSEIVGHYERIALGDEQKLLKRLIDVQNFPDLTSPELDMRLAHLRNMLVMKDGNLGEHLGLAPRRPGTIASQLAGQIAGMVRSGGIDVFDVYKACAVEEKQNQLLEQPVRVLSQLIT